MSHLIKLNQTMIKNYHELLPGVLTKGYKNAESVYIEDDLFVFLTPAIKYGYEPYDSFNRFEIPKGNWIQIIRGFVILKDYLLNHQTAGLFEYLLPHFKTQTENYLKEYLNNRHLIDEIIKDLIIWIEEQLTTNEYITLIGL